MIGPAFFTFGDRAELGNPLSLYIYQGARLFNITNYLSFNYELNLGLSFWWKNYNQFYNEYNKIIGSKVNAYINVNTYFLWKLYDNLSLTTGIGVSHFSNGNTKLPNAGLNTVSFKLGLDYKFSSDNTNNREKNFNDSNETNYNKFFNLDLTLFGSYRRKVVNYEGEMVSSPYKYLVLGFNIAPMYNIGHKFRTGISIDGLYDSSSGVHVPESKRGDLPKIVNADFRNRLALGLSARFEYVMPIFTIGAGIGTNILKGDSDLRSVYQLLYLKAYYIKRSYIHIGYSLHNFDTPNFLMLGVGVTLGKRNNTL